MTMAWKWVQTDEFKPEARDHPQTPEGVTFLPLRVALQDRHKAKSTLDSSGMFNVGQSYANYMCFSIFIAPRKEVL